MPRILVIDPEGTGVGMARRLHDEGADVRLYVHPQHNRDNGQGIVHKLDSLHQGLGWLKGEPGSIAFFLSSGMGKRAVHSDPDKRVPLGADEFRKAGIATVCGGSLCDRLEQDRIFGEQIAQAMGCKTPPTKTFATISQAIAFCKSAGEDEWYFKSDRYLNADATQGGTGTYLADYLAGIRAEYGDRIPNILQKKIKGVALSTACWWNGRAFIPPYEATIEHKKAYNDDLGPSTGCAVNAVWFYEQAVPQVVRALRWEQLAPMLLKYEAPPGLYDINAIVDEQGEAYFLEWTCRAGWDSEPTSLRLLDVPMVEFFERLVQGRLSDAPFRTSELSYAVRLGIPPYPFEGYKDDKGSAKGVVIDGADGLWDGFFFAYSVMANERKQLACADRWGLLGVAGDTDANLSTAHERVLDYCKDDLNVPGLGYRTDGDKVLAKDAAALRKVGYEIHAGMLR